MARRILTAREQLEMLSPWREAALDHDLTNRLDKEFHQWWDENGEEPEDFFGESSGDEDGYGADPNSYAVRGPLGNWPNIENFLKDRYPAAHKDLEFGDEEASIGLDGKWVNDKYETGPQAIHQHGYDPKEIAAGMLLLHNSSHPGRGDWYEEDQKRLNDIAQKRFQMQRNYDQRQVTAGYGDPMGEQDWNEIYPDLPDTIHRGVGITLPDDLHKMVHDPSIPIDQRAQALLRHIGTPEARTSPWVRHDSREGLGTSWSGDEGVAEDFGRSMADQHTDHNDKHARENDDHTWGTDEDGDPVGKPGTAVMLHAELPDIDSIDDNPNGDGSGQRYTYHGHGEQEVPVHGGHALNIKGISWRPILPMFHPDYLTDPEEYTRHEFGENNYHTAATDPTHQDENWEHDYMQRLRQEREDRRQNATKIYRGLRFDAPPDLQAHIDEHYRKDVPYDYDEIGGHLAIGPKLLDHLQVSHPNLLSYGSGYGHDDDDRLGLGRHWTTHRQLAEKAAMQGGKGRHSVILEAERPSPEHLDPNHTGVGGSRDGGRTPWESEEEDTLLPGTPLNITSVHLNDKEVLHDPKLEKKMPEQYGLPYPGGPRQHTAALSEDEGRKMREVYAPHDPANPPEHLRPHLMLPIGSAHHYREYDRPYDDVLGQVIADQGIRQPLRISTDGTHATMHEGNHRLEVAKRLGLTHVPVQVTLEKPGEVINNGGRPPAPLEGHLGEWVDQNRHRLKSFWS